MRTKMHYIHTRAALKDRRRELRKNSTPEEKMIWQHLRKHKQGYRFYRQHSIGHYIVDFYCAEKRLIIELDGNHHTENIEYDAERTAYLNSLNFNVIRFWNNDINKNLKSVLEIIAKTITIG